MDHSIRDRFPGQQGEVAHRLLAQGEIQILRELDDTSTGLRYRFKCSRYAESVPDLSFGALSLQHQMGPLTVG